MKKINMQKLNYEIREIERILTKIRKKVLNQEFEEDELENLEEELKAVDKNLWIYC